MNQLNPEVKLMPLRRVVSSVTGEADENDDQAIRKAIRRWHNRLSNGSVPRSIFKKIGKELFLDLMAFEAWIKHGSGQKEKLYPGFPRSPVFLTSGAINQRLKLHLIPINVNRNINL